MAVRAFSSIRSRFTICSLVLACITWIAGGTSRAQSAAPFPSQMVRIVVPFSAGSTSDLLARMVSERLSKRWQQQVIVENRPGIAGTASVAKAEPNGFTLLMTSNGHAILDKINTTLTFDPIKDFVGISKVASLPLVLIVPPDSAAKSPSDLVDMARASPGKIGYASAGLGSVSHIGSELLKRVTKTDIQPVPYRGAPDALTGVMRGDTQMCLATINVAVDLIQTGKVRALAVSGKTRSQSLPEVPTFAESGMPEFEYEAWFGLLAPANTANPILSKINEDVVAIVQSDEIARLLANQGATAVASTPEQLNKALRAESDQAAGLFPKSEK